MSLCTHPIVKRKGEMKMSDCKQDLMDMCNRIVKQIGIFIQRQD